MNGLPPNLFNALFDFFPREGHSPKENFLSESFAYVVKTCGAARDAWLTLAFGQSVKSKSFEVTTRQTEVAEAGEAVFPDTRISGVLENGTDTLAVSEEHWAGNALAAGTQSILRVVFRPKSQRRVRNVMVLHSSRAD